MVKHNSHCIYKFFCETLDPNIYQICLPSHASNRLQPLNVGIIGLLPKAYIKQLDQWRTDRNENVNPHNFW